MLQLLQIKLDAATVVVVVASQGYTMRKYYQELRSFSNNNGISSDGKRQVQRIQGSLESTLPIAMIEVYASAASPVKAT